MLLLGKIFSESIFEIKGTATSMFCEVQGIRGESSIMLWDPFLELTGQLLKLN